MKNKIKLRCEGHQVLWVFICPEQPHMLNVLRRLIFSTPGFCARQHLSHVRLTGFLQMQF